MNKVKNKNQKGFLLIGLLIVAAIIAILFVIYNTGSSGEKGNVKTTGQKAIEQTKRNNQTELEQQIEIQNQLNSIE